jgi:hypothetical protein
MLSMFVMRIFALFFLTILLIDVPAGAQTAPSVAQAIDAAPTTQPAFHRTDLLGPTYTSHVHGIQFRAPLGSAQSDKPQAPDSIVEFDQDQYNWQLKAWSSRLETSLPLTVHKDQFGNSKDGVMEITLANIKQQSPDAQVLRDEVIYVGRVRVGMLAVRYETATHDRRYTQQAIIEAPDADNRLYYFLDLTGPGKPQSEPDDVVNPAEKLAFDTFGQVVDSVVLLDRSGIVEFQKESLYGTMGLFVLWNGNNYEMVRTAIAPEEYRRIISDNQDVGYEHIVETFEPNGKSPEESTLKIGVRTTMMPTPLRRWDTETWMYCSADRKHEHWKTSVRCTDNKGQLIDSFSQVGMSDEETHAYSIQPEQNADGSLLPGDESVDKPMGPLGQGNVDIETRRTLEVTTTHQNAQLNPFHMQTPVFYIPQAFSFLLPQILPLKPKSYMFATFVANTPQNSSAASSGNVMPRYVSVLPVQQVKFRGQEFDAIPVTDKVTLDGPVTTIYLGTQGKFLGSTTTVTDGDKTNIVEVVPTDSDTLGHIWNRPDLTAPNEPAGDVDNVLPPPKQ